MVDTIEEHVHYSEIVISMQKIIGKVSSNVNLITATKPQPYTKKGDVASRELPHFFLNVSF